MAKRAKPGSEPAVVGANSGHVEVKPQTTRGGRTDPDIKKALDHLAADDTATAAGIHRALERQFGAGVLSVKTVQAMVRRVRRRRSSRPWTMADATADEAAAVLPVLGELLRSSGELGRWAERTLTADEAAWIVKLRRAVPDLPPPDTLRFARRYLARAAAGEPTLDLDRALATGGWRDLEAAVAAYYGEGDMYLSKERSND